MSMKKCLVAAIAAAVTGLSANTAFAGGMGVCTHMGIGYDVSSNIAAVEDGDIPWLRDECRWTSVEPTKGTKRIPDSLKNYMASVDEKGINQLLILGYGNPVYGIERDSVVPRQSNAEYYSAYLDYVRFTVNEVKDYVEAYEVWNEPNISMFNYNLAASGTDYAKLYLDTRAIIKELDPTARILCGCITGYSTTDLNYGKAIFDYIKTQGSVNALIDIFSIHLYTGGSESKYAAGLSAWENVFDSYGFTGDVCMTETGTSASYVSETVQASYIARHGVLWEKYLADNGRNGEIFWYDLRNDQTGDAYEDNLGLTYSSYAPKPAYYAMKAYNDLTKGKTLISYETPQTYYASSGFLGLGTTTYNGVKAKYSDGKDSLYVVYNDVNGSVNRTVSVELSGDVAYVYDYSGNVTETISSPSGTKAITPGVNPTYVECVTYRAEIDSAVYDSGNKTISVSGTYNRGDSLTLEMIKEGSVQQSITAKVTDGEYSKWFSVLEPGTYTLRAGYPELAAAGKTSGWTTKSITVTADTSTVKEPSFAEGMAVSYDAAQRKIRVSGSITDPVDDQYVTVLAIPATMDINSIDTNAVGYAKQIPTVNGAFSVDFTLPEYYTTRTAIYLGGTGIEAKQTNYANIEENKYLYVASLDINTESTLSATAMVRNFAETEKKASIIIAQYSSDGRLVAVSSENKTIPARTYAAVESKLNGVSVEKNATNAIAYIWDDIDGLTPLAELDEVDISR
ncbi:MAG: hypothetical protein IJH37_12485 [Clostridia bacterium]|nr:hypothetical protein [Clostridia bacterium]